MKMFRMENNCTVLPLYGTLDLGADMLPICGRMQMQMMMPMMRMMRQDTRKMMETMPDCPLACVEDYVDTDLSSTSLPDDTFDNADDIYGDLSVNMTKEEALIMEFYFTSLTTEVFKMIKY